MSMTTHHRMLIVTTDSDPSIDLFTRENAKRLITPTVITYDISDISLRRILHDQYDYVYFRDPFNSPHISQTVASRTTETILESMNHTYSVDTVQAYDSLLFEDKWRQYEIFSAYMPPTELLHSVKSVDFSTHIAKKRISSRARGIVLQDKDFPQDATASDYIVQPKLSITTEYRVYMVGDEILLPLAIKSSKTSAQKVKVIGATHDLPSEIAAICKVAYDATHFDLMGLDIAQTPEGFFLLEVNRSCQFKGYLRKSNVNLAEILNTYLLARR